jgi:hypothetical protein
MSHRVHQVHGLGHAGLSLAPTLQVHGLGHAGLSLAPTLLLIDDDNDCSDHFDNPRSKFLTTQLKNELVFKGG